MPSKIFDAVRYVVRAVGMVLVVGVSAFLLFAALFSKEPNVLGACASAWCMAAGVLSWPRLPDAWRRDPPTEKQLRYAESLGITVPPGASKGELSDLISQVAGR